MSHEAVAAFGQKANKHDFYKAEVGAITDGIKGPVDSFTVRDDANILAQAVETGVIEPGAFANCAIFDDDESALQQKTKRYELNRALRIYDILTEENTELSLGDKLERLDVRQQMLRAVVIEASRKYNREAATGTLTDRNRDLYTRVLDQAQEDLYPSADPEIISYSSALVMNKIAENNPDLHAMLAGKYPFMNNEVQQAEPLMSAEKRQAWYDYLHETYDPVFAEVKEAMGDKISNDTLVKATTLFMQRAGFEMTDDPDDHSKWMVEARSDVTGFRVEPEILRILCGKRSKEITWPIFQQLMMHEVIVHASRAQHGYESGYKALQIGVPGNQEPEEGLGILVEKLWAGGSLDAVGRDHYRYLALCYADGALDTMKHTETETYDFITDIMASTQPTDAFSERKASVGKAAYDHVKRAFRGMPKGHIMKSNLAYLSGKLKMARFLDRTEATPAETLTYLQSGKFNPLDPEQATIPNQLQQAA